MNQAEANALPHHDEGCAVTQDGDCDCNAPRRVAMEALTSVLYDAAGAAVAVVLRVGEFDDGDADPSFFIDNDWDDWLTERYPDLKTGSMVDLFEDTDNVYQWIVFVKPPYVCNYHRDSAGWDECSDTPCDIPPHKEVI